MKHKKEKKIKEEDANESELVEPTDSYEEKLKFVNGIAKPMAPKSLSKKLYKLIKKAGQQKGNLRSGIKNVQKFIRKGERGIVVFAGDITPIEIMCHMPVVCEELHMPYCYTPSKVAIGKAMGVKRQTLTVLIKEHEDFADLFKTCSEQIGELPMDFA